VMREVEGKEGKKGRGIVIDQRHGLLKTRICSSEKYNIYIYFTSNTSLHSDTITLGLNNRSSNCRDDTGWTDAYEQ